jgi:hypothetical protein
MSVTCAWPMGILALRRSSDIGWDYDRGLEQMDQNFLRVSLRLGSSLAAWPRFSSAVLMIGLTHIAATRHGQSNVLRKHSPVESGPAAPLTQFAARAAYVGRGCPP